jgi:hypothetical protein
MGKTLRCALWTSAAPLLWLSAGATSLAGGAKLTAGIEPAFTACLAASSSCTKFVRTQFRIQYKLFSVPGFSARIRLLRAYQMTVDDDQDEGSSEEQQTSRFDPPFDLADVKLRFTAPDGRDRFEARAGYSYQHSNPYNADGYHAAYVSGEYYFGPRMASGWGGLSRRFDVLLRISQNLYATSNRPLQRFVQLVPTYTVPLTNDGSTRAYASYAREVGISGISNTRTPSNRFELGAYRNPARWLELYARMAWWATRGVPGTARVVAGADITI